MCSGVAVLRVRTLVLDIGNQVVVAVRILSNLLEQQQAKQHKRKLRKDGVP